MGCCRRIFARNIARVDSVICLRWVLPLRLLILGTLAGSVFYTLSKQGHLSGLEVLLVIVHLVLSFTVLNECQRSVSLHKLLRYDKK